MTAIEHIERMEAVLYRAQNQAQPKQTPATSLPVQSPSSPSNDWLNEFDGH